MVEPLKHLLLLLLQQRLQRVNQLEVVNLHQHRTVTKVQQLTNLFQQLQLKLQHHQQHHNVINVNQLLLHPKLSLLAVNQHRPMMSIMKTLLLPLVQRLPLLPMMNQAKVKRKVRQAENAPHQNRLQLQRKKLVAKRQ